MGEDHLRPLLRPSTAEDLVTTNPSIVIFRLCLVGFIGIVSIWANHEASKGYAITIVNESGQTLPGKRFQLLYVSNDEATRIILEASRSIESFLYSDTPTTTKKPIGHVILKLAGRGLTDDVVVDSVADKFVINISPSVLEGTNFGEAVVLAIRKGVARVWVWDNAPINLINGIVEYIVVNMAASPGRAEAEPPDAAAACDSRRVAGSLSYFERRRQGFIRGLNAAMKDGILDGVLVGTLLRFQIRFYLKNHFSTRFQILTKMTQDVEMKEQQPAPSNSLSPTSPSILQHLKDIAGLIEVGAYTREVRRIVRAIRWTIQLRKNLKASVVSAVLDFALVPRSEVHSRLSSYVPQEDEQDMEIDSATSVAQVPAKHLLPEIEIYCYLLVLIFLIDQKRYNEAKVCSSAGIARLRNLNRRTVDVLASRLYFYYSLSYELTGDLAEIRGNLLALHRTATLRHDELGQETILNLLLRNYLHYNLYDQAEKLRAKAPRFEAHSNQQFCRYLFYVGKIRTIQLEYTDAKESLLQAARKAPVSALGFRVQCNKWAVIVRLLLGEIPERTVFMQKGMEKALRPYFELTNAVRIGDLELFKSVAEKFANTFSSDGTKNLIVRLRHNVIRTGLRNISISYSKISLVDVAKKLRLDTPNPVADAESIVSKAIRDGAIDATLDHGNGWMVSKETGDVYSTNEPQIAFNSRVAFCLNMHNEAVRALRFPPNSHKEKESAEKRRERQQQEQELAKHIAEEDDDEF